MLVKHFNVDVLYEIEKTLNLAATKAPSIHISYKEWRLFRDSVLVSHQPQRKLFFFFPTSHYSPLIGQCHRNEISTYRNFADLEMYLDFELIWCKQCTDIQECTLGSYILKTLFTLQNILQNTVQAVSVL